MKSIDLTVKTEIKKLLQSGFSHREIAAKLHCSVGTVSNVRKNLRKPVGKSIAGPKPKLSLHTKQLIIRSICNGSIENAVQMKKHLDTYCNINVSAETVRRTLREVQMCGRTKGRRVPLTPEQKELRVLFARKYEHFTEADWQRIIWSDIIRINYFESDEAEWTWKLPKDQTEMHPTTQKLGSGFIMIWGCMMADGVGCLQQVDDKMTAKSYISILENNLTDSLTKWNKSKSDVIFQQDNDPKHKVKSTEWLRNQGFAVLDWPPQSPDLNPIDHLWSLLKKAILYVEHGTRSKAQLWIDVKREWESITQEQCKNLVNSMPKRMKAVIKAKGGYTKF